MTREKPILFSAPMVRAILDGAKTQTRRLVKLRDGERVHVEGGEVYPLTTSMSGSEQRGAPIGRPFSVGDRLWVREAWRADERFDDRPPRDIPEWSPTLMLADETHRGGHVERPGRYRHARFMPRHFSRIDLHVTDVRVERLGYISEADCIAEGAVHAFEAQRREFREAGVRGSDATWHPLRCFPWLWCQVHGPDAWERDCQRWVWVYTFEVAR